MRSAARRAARYRRARRVHRPLAPSCGASPVFRLSWRAAQESVGIWRGRQRLDIRFAVVSEASLARFDYARMLRSKRHQHANIANTYAAALALLAFGILKDCLLANAPCKRQQN
jgi:hypothetical protein